MTVVRFRSKVDVWLALALTVTPALAIASTLSTGVQMESLTALAVIGGVYFGLLFPLRYELHADALVVRAGLLVRYRRPYSSMIAATPNRSPMSAPALSLDRLLIRSHDAMGVNISPADRAHFLAVLAQRAPHLARTRGTRGLSLR